MDKVEMQRLFLNYLVRGDNKIAIRGLRHHNNGSYERVFDDVSKAVDYANGLEAAGSCKGVYFTINPLNDNYDGNFAKDADIKVRHTLFIDIDANRNPAPPLEGHKVSSNQDELDATISLSKEIVEYLASHGITQEPIIAISGNGTHLYYSIDMPNDDASLDTLKYFLKHIGDVFNGEKGDVDMTIRNAARIAKLTGTMATKGPNNVEVGREHRMAQVIQWPSKDAAAWQCDTVDASNIVRVADMAREEEQAAKRNKAADRKAKSRGGRATNYTPRQASVKTQKEGKQMSNTFINRNDFIINNASSWINAAYEKVASPDDRNQWLGILTSVKTILGESGYAAFDSWCAASTHYDANNNRASWDSPASGEDVATEALKLAYSFIKMGMDLDEIAETLGYELSKEAVMSIEEIKAAIESDDSLTVRWAWSTRLQKMYPAGVWSKNIEARRLTSMDATIKLNSLMSVFVSTEDDNGFLNPVLPFVMNGTEDMYVFNEEFGIWDRMELTDINRIVNSMSGYTVTGKKNGRETYLAINDAARESRQILAIVRKLSPMCEKKLAFNNMALVYDENKVIQRAAVSEDYFTHKMDMDYLGATATPEFDAILERLFEGDAERIECYLQWAGAAIMGANVSLQIPMLFLISEVGGTGKSMLLQLLERIIGSQQTASPKMSDLKDRGILIALANKSLVVDYDVNLDCMVDNLDVLKKLIMGEGMTMRDVGTRTNITVRYRGAVCGAANGTPSFKNYDSGVDRRILIIPTTNKAVTKSEMVREYDRKVFEKEGNGIVFKMVEAFKRMLDAGELVIPAACQDAKEQFRAEVDPMASWFEQTYEFDFEARVEKASALFQNYQAWCQISNHQPVSITRFTRAMSAKAKMEGEGLMAKSQGSNGFRVKMKSRIGF